MDLARTCVRILACALTETLRPESTQQQTFAFCEYQALLLLYLGVIIESNCYRTSVGILRTMVSPGELA